MPCSLSSCFGRPRIRYGSFTAWTGKAWLVPGHARLAPLCFHMQWGACLPGSYITSFSINSQPSRSTSHPSLPPIIPTDQPAYLPNQHPHFLAHLPPKAECESLSTLSGEQWRLPRVLVLAIATPGPAFDPLAVLVLESAAPPLEPIAMAMFRWAVSLPAIRQPALPLNPVVAVLAAVLAATVVPEEEKAEARVGHLPGSPRT